MVVNKIFPRIFPGRRVVWCHLCSGQFQLVFLGAMYTKYSPKVNRAQWLVLRARSNCTLTRNYGFFGKWPRLLSVDVNKFYFFLSMWYGVYLYTLHGAYSYSRSHSVIEFFTGKIVLICGPIPDMNGKRSVRITAAHSHVRRPLDGIQ